MKTYNLDLTSRFEVTFTKNGVAHKKGDKIAVGIVIASKLYNEGKIALTDELQSAAKRMKCEDLFIVANKKGE